MTKPLALHYHESSIAMQLTQFATEAGLKTKLLHQTHPDNIVHLTANSQAPFAFIHGCIFLAGFAKHGENSSVAHLPSGEGTQNEDRTRRQIAELVEKVGKDATFAVAGMPLSKHAVRRRLLNIITSELELHGAAVEPKHVSWLGEEPNGVLVDPRNKVMHVFLKIKELIG